MTFADAKARLYRGVLRDDLLTADFYGTALNIALREIQNRRSFTPMKEVVYVSVAPGVSGQGGNLVQVGATWPAGPGALQVTLSGFAVGAKYYYNKNDSTALTTDGTTVVRSDNGFFVAKQDTYILTGPEENAEFPIMAAVIASGPDQTAKLPRNFKELQKWRAVNYVSDDGQFIPTDVVFEAQQIYRVWVFGGTPIVTWPPRAYLERRDDYTVLGILEPLIQKFNFQVKYYKFLPDLVEDSDTSPLLDLYPEMVIAKAKEVCFNEINDPQAATEAMNFETKFQAAARADAFSEVVGRELRM